jgi:hypothetical protein
MALKDFDKAKTLLEGMKDKASDPAAVERAINGLALYSRVQEAMDNGDHKTARNLLGTLFNQRNELAPELVALVASAKSGYDRAQMEGLVESDPTAAANMGGEISEY